MQRSQVTEKLCRIIRTIETVRMPVPVKELYVFGSYARGAATCGDLNIVVVTAEPTEEDEARCPARCFMNIADFDKEFRKLLKTARSERIDILRVPQSLPEQVGPVKREDCVLIWNGDSSWRDRIAANEPNPLAERFPKRQYLFTGQGFAKEPEELWQWLEEAVAVGAIRVRRLAMAKFQAQTWPRIERVREAGLVNDSWADLYGLAASYLASQGQESEFCNLLNYRRIWRSTDNTVFLHLGRPRISYIIEWLQNGDIEWAGALPFPKKTRPVQIWVFERGRGFAKYVKDRPLVV